MFKDYFVLYRLFRRWFDRRMPRSDNVVLNHKSTYIWPSAYGYLTLMVCIIMLIGAINYQNNLAFLLTFLLIGIGLVSLLSGYKNLQGIRLILNAQKEVFESETVVIELSLSSASDKSHFSIGVGESKSNMTWCDILHPEMTKVILHLHCKSRGLWSLPRMVTMSRFPFGWFSVWSYFAFEHTVLIYPKPIEPPANVIKGDGLDQSDEGEETIEGIRKSGSEDFHELRNYQAGESMNRIDWKSYAREKGLFIREFTESLANPLVFDWDNFVLTEDELKISYLTYMVIQASEQNMSYALKLPGHSISMNDGDQHRRDCLALLATYQLPQEAREW